MLINELFTVAEAGNKNGTDKSSLIAGTFSDSYDNNDADTHNLLRRHSRRHF